MYFLILIIKNGGKCMKKHQKLICIMITLVMTLGMLGGCGKETESLPEGTQSENLSGQADESGTADEGVPEETAVSLVDFSEHETFTLWLQADSNDYYSDYSENPIVRYMNNKFNITLEFQQPAAGTEKDALSLMFGTGEYTDLIEMSQYSGSITDLYEEGVIIDIADYLDYMPNLSRWLETDETFRKNCYSDDGHIYTLRSIRVEDELMWGGLMYRRDILDDMTDGNPSFPSGNDEPVTIEDWDYMLPLFKEYFEEAGVVEYAAFIIPSNGTFGYGELVNGFGVSSNYYYEDGKVKYGPMEDGFYNYLKKMREWYEAGYIYKDFASRTNDMFFMPNTALTYGGTAGVWYGLTSQLGDAMSSAEYDLNFDVQPLMSPVDSGNGIAEATALNITRYAASSDKGYAVYSGCKNIEKILAAWDFLYSEEGGMLNEHGLTVEQGADTDPIYVKGGMQEGAYWFEDGEFVFNPLLAVSGGTIDESAFIGIRLTGFHNNYYRIRASSELTKLASEKWTAYSNPNKDKLPVALSYEVEEENILADNNVLIRDYVKTMVPKFIMGTETLDDEAWEKFQAQLVSYGVEEAIQIQQEAYDRYMNR